MDAGEELSFVGVGGKCCIFQTQFDDIIPHKRVGIGNRLCLMSAFIVPCVHAAFVVVAGVCT